MHHSLKNVQNTKTSRLHSSNEEHYHLLNSSDNFSNWWRHPGISVSYCHHQNSSCPYVLRKEVIYSGRKRYKTLHLHSHSSFRDSWRNQWLRPVAQPRNLFWRGSHWRLSDNWKLIQSTSKNLSKLFSGGPGFFGLILAVTEVTKHFHCSIFHAKGMCGQVRNQGGKPDNCNSRSFQKHVYLLVTTTSYKHIFLHLEISACCGPACASGWIIEKCTFSQSSWCALLRDSIRWNDWSWQWFPVTLAGSTDCRHVTTGGGGDGSNWPPQFRKYH